tara:strand:- start:6998 stop:8185 length:1188 start_codon:yes stop_codon:yes gene_type:complete
MREKLLFINISGTNSNIKFFENDIISENFEFKLKGYQKGKIVDNDSFFESFMNPKLSRVLNYQNIDKLIFGISPYEIYSKVDIVPIYNFSSTKPVEEKDLLVESSFENSDYSLLHSISLGYILDGKDMLSNPIGMHARKLESIKLNVAVNNEFVSNLRELCKLLNISCPINIILNSIALTNELIDEENKDFGCFHINIGTDLTELSMIQKDKVLDLAVIPVGEENFVRDIEISLDITPKDAKLLVENFGSVMPELIKENDHLLVHTTKGQEEKISNKRVGAIMRERANELLQISKKYFDENSKGKISTNRIFISGPGSKYNGFDSLLKYVFQNFIYRNKNEKNESENYLINFYLKENKNLNNFDFNYENKNILNSKLFNNNNLIKTKLKKLLKIG